MGRIGKVSKTGVSKMGVSEMRVYEKAINETQKQTDMFNKAKVGDVIAAKVVIKSEDINGKITEKEVVRKTVILEKYPYFLRCKDKDNKIHCIDKMDIVSA